MLVVAAGVGRRPFAQVLRNSLSGHPPTTGLRDIFRFTPVVGYRVIVMGRFWTTWQVFRQFKNSATLWILTCYNLQEWVNHPPSSLTYICNVAS